jgi:hypothetical protein
MASLLNLLPKNAPIDRLEWAGEPVCSCLIAAVYQVVSERQVYHSTRRWYDPKTCFYLSLDDAFKVVEQKRVRGTHWIVNELPTLAVVGQFRSILITQVNSSAPLAGVEVPRGSWFNLKDVVKHFPGAANHSANATTVCRFVIEGKDVTPPDSSFSRWESVPAFPRVLSDMELEWDVSIREAYKPNAVELLRDAILGTLPPIGVLG